ncbi:hypothetical protein JR316_0007986 [Psilocybe cubensis]|uniref:Uncharacterized protein n=1 Tax=Psilocybe cubensis TaxID=181762 RepID=A0ACB8GW01_PSICU|nr:hypothetical protein JR316_0007986 [Psilocybe cubensis]KAH9479396.1 hypothetical protein JR316_0007986 [Psilocybe cubensis]
MISDSLRGSKAPSKAATKPLKRGRACMSCRFLKIKCDGEKPVCGPCRNHPRDDECEYSDGPGRSRTKTLEEQVSRLEARILELEHPDSSTPSVVLHDPYPSPFQVERHSKSPPLHLPEHPPAFAPLSPFSPTSTTSSLPSGRHWNKFSALGEKTELTGSSGSSTSPIRHPVAMPYLGAEGQESALLIRAVQHVSTDLMGTHPNKVIHTLQAEVLLAYYFLRTGSLLEAKCRTGTAISLALGSGLHKIRSANFLVPSTISIGSHDQAHLLPHPSDALQEAERINGFWAVLVLHKFITVALEVPAHVCGALEAPGMLIDTPWPIDIDQFEEGIIPPELQGNSTVRAFLNGYLVDNHNGESSTALVAKAAILFHRAAHLTGQWSPSMHIPSLIVAIINSMIFEDMTPRDKVAYDAAAKSVNTLLETFRAKLGVRPRLNPQDPSVRTILLIHALVDAASIKLHWIFSYAYPESKQICLSAARNIVNYGDFDLQGLTIINPIMGNLWMTACLVFVDEISRARQMRSGWPEHASVEEELMESYRSGLKAMSLFSQDSVLMRYQLTKVQEAFEVI